MRDSLYDFEECLCLNFLSCAKNTPKFIDNKKNNTDGSEDCLLDEENDPSKLRYFNFESSFKLRRCRARDLFGS